MEGYTVPDRKKYSVNMFHQLQIRISLSHDMRKPAFVVCEQQAEQTS